MPMRLITALAAALVLAVAGCGGEEGGAGSGGGAAEVVPASAAVYVSINADVDSDQWQQLLDLIRKFPDHQQLESQVLRSLTDEGVDWKQDVDPAFGPEVGIAVFLDGTEPLVVGLTQPDDKAKLNALVERGDQPSVTTEVEGWTLVADQQAALDAFTKARDSGTLADQDAFKSAVDGLPGESLGLVYVGGEGVRKLAEQAGQGAAAGGAQLESFESFALAVTSEDDGLALEGVARVGGDGNLGETYKPELLDRVPAGPIAVVSFKGQSDQIDQLRQNPALSQQLVEAERALGVKLEDIARLFADEGVLYVRSAAPFPEVTAFLKIEDETQAKQTLDTLARKIATLAGGTQLTVRQTTVEGVQTTQVDAGPVSVYFATQDGLLVVTTSPSGIRAAGGVDESLADDDDFKSAKDAAGMGDETSGFLYIDLDTIVPLVEGFAGVAEQQVPPQVVRNLEPLDSFVLFAERDGDEFTIAGRLGVH